MADNEEKLRRQYSQTEPESPPGQEPQSFDDQTDANPDQDVEEQIEVEVLEEMDMLDIFEMNAERGYPLRDSSPASILESPTPESSVDLPIITEQQENSKKTGIIEYVIKTSESNERTAGAPPKRAKVRRPKRVSLVRFLPHLTDEEEQLEARMVQMGLFVCKVCKEDCHSLPKLREHVNRLHDSKVYNLCCNNGLHYYSVSKLYDHIRWHLDSDKFKCELCDTHFTNTQCLTQHKLRMHPEGQPTFVCDVCGKGFFTKYTLSKHSQTHERVACKYCGKGENIWQKISFASLSNNMVLLLAEFSAGFINLHLKEHEIVFNYLCDICGRAFSSLGRLNCHVNDHGGPHGGRRKKKKPKVKFPTFAKEIFGDDYFKL